MSALGDLGLTIPLVAAPMAGGPSTPALVAAAGRAGALGFLAGGYKTAGQLAEQISETRSTTAVFGVNLFAPNPLPVDPVAYARYAADISADGRPYGVDVEGIGIREDDDEWSEKVDLLLADPVAVASFTFGIPERSTVIALQRARTVVVQTVTTHREATLAAEAGVDVLAVQSAAAGGHSATLTPADPPGLVPMRRLLSGIRAVTGLPMIAAGGLTVAQDIRDVLDFGAEAAMVGTALLRSDESGASATFKDALADPTRNDTVVTRAFTGRPARGVRNAFIDDHHSQAPLGYPAIHHLTSPLRKAAAAAGDAERINLWAGPGFPQAKAAPAGAILLTLAAGL